ncbi:nitrophenyl compound nitroreductase subunit ArsF family protein [Chloroflexota bacterium]
MKTLFGSFYSFQRYLRISVFFIVGLLLIGLPGCSATTPPETQAPTGEPSAPSMTTATTVNIDLLYFHRPQRCTKCLCFERRVSYVISEYFQAEIDSGQLTFQILNIGDKENYALVQKYGAVGSQLFLNTIINDEEHIKDIQEIWAWDCTSNTDRFDREVKNTIELSLNSEK